MSDKGYQDEDQIGGQKKLRKQEKRLRERLQEAQQAQDNALERLRRAEARMRKRVQDVQRLEGRLGIIDQQMRALNAPLSTIVTLIPTVAESAAAREAARSSETTPEKPPVQPVDTVQQVPQTEISEALAPIEVPVSYSTSTEAADTATYEQESADPEPVGQASEGATIPEQPVEAEITAGEMVAGEAEPQFLERFSASVEAAPGDKETGDDEVPATRTLDPAVQRAKEARAVAEAAEEEARDAIERAEDVVAYLEQIGSARHLLQELEQLEDEAAQAAAYAREMDEAANLAERAVAGSDVADEDVKLTAEEKQIIAAIPSEEERELDPVDEQSEEDFSGVLPDIQVDVVQEVQGEQPALPSEEVHSAELANGRQNSQAGGVHTYAYPTQLEIMQVEEIDEEEETLETVTSMIIADAAAVAAAEAEALAEASSARTREARSAALEADRALGTIRLAVRNGVLVGEEAEAALKAAERDATHAHAVLADAEAAEERARNAAMNAEAEAEVAEGMAFASGERNERDEKLRDEYGTAHPLPAEEPTTVEAGQDDADLELNDEDDEDEEEDTQKLPHLHPEQS